MLPTTVALPSTLQLENGTSRPSPKNAKTDYFPNSTSDSLKEVIAAA
jgi:hypothetical protein